MPYALLADDLTGAMDAGVQWTQFAKAAVFWDTPLPRLDENLVLSTQSRNLSWKEAQICVKNAYATLTECGYHLLYKKVDSTMRGEIGAELAALLEVGKYRFALLCPALPDAKRTVKDGILYVNGLPLMQSDIALDPYARITSSDLTLLLTRNLPLQIGRFAPSEHLKEELCAFSGDIALVDAQTQEDLDLIASCLTKDILPCGSAGLFGAICRQKGKILLADAAPAQTKASPRSLLTLCGSPALQSRLQLKKAQDAGQAVYALTENDRFSILNKARSALKKKESVVLDAAQSTKEALLQTYKDDPVSLQKAGDKVQSLLKQAALALMDVADGLCVFGGDSALSVLQALSARGLQLKGEAENLVPYGLILGGPCEGRFFSTKAGGLGSENVLKSVQTTLETLKKENR